MKKSFYCIVASVAAVAGIIATAAIICNKNKRKPSSEKRMDKVSEKCKRCSEKKLFNGCDLGYLCRIYEEQMKNE